MPKEKAEYRLTEKQKRFADEYLIDCNGTRAYKAAYQAAKRTARQMQMQESYSEMLGFGNTLMKSWTKCALRKQRMRRRLSSI